MPVNELDWVSELQATKVSRSRGGARLLADPSLTVPLVKLAFEEDEALGKKALWAMEEACLKDPAIMIPVLPQLAQNAGIVKQDSNIRALSKIFSIFSKWADQEKHLQHLPPTCLEKMAGTCFQWLTGPYKAATKAHSMTALYHLGTVLNWIYPELQALLEKDYGLAGPAYKARARMVLKSLEQIKGS